MLRQTGPLQTQGQRIDTAGLRTVGGNEQDPAGRVEHEPVAPAPRRGNTTDQREAPGVVQPHGTVAEHPDAVRSGIEQEVTKLREAAKNPLLTEDARLQKRNEAEEKLTELQEFQLRARRTQETKLKQLREQLMKSRQGIVDELLAAVAEFGQAEGYDLVLDRSGMTMNMIPLTVYSAPGLDVTDKLIERLKK